MVHFPEFAHTRLWIHRAVRGFYPRGFPHSEIPGSKPACGSPRLIAACHVLHRLLLPRHSPCALSSLTIKFTRHIPDESGLRRGKFYGPKFLLIARLDAFAFSVTPLRHVVLRATKSPCWPKPNAEILRSFSPLIAAPNRLHLMRHASSDRRVQALPKTLHRSSRKRTHRNSSRRKSMKLS